MVGSKETPRWLRRYAPVLTRREGSIIIVDIDMANDIVGESDNAVSSPDHNAEIPAVSFLSNRHVISNAELIAERLVV